jgi:hypothetical protein
MGNTSYAPGEVVDLHFAGSVVTDAGEGFITVQTAHDEVTLSTEAPDCRIVRVTPADGAPRPGEVWRDAHGQIWFARGDDKRVAFYGADSKAQHPGGVSLDWQAVHRDTGPIERIWTEQPVEVTNA